MSKWCNDYLNIPFKEKGRDREGVDCWGLVCIIYKEQRGIILPDYLECYTHTNERELLADTIQKERQEWIFPEKEKEFDVAIISMAGYPMHVGIVVSQGMMIHCQKDIGVSVERYDNMRWRHKIKGFSRWPN